MRTIAAVAAGLVVTILVATSVTLAVLQYQARTNNQQVNLRNGVTLSQDSAIVQAAAKARPAVVSIVTQRQPTIVDGSGYLATSDGYIVTNINVIAGASGMTVLVPGDAKPHDARLVDYDCQTGVAVIGLDRRLRYLAVALPQMRAADTTVGREAILAESFLNIQKIRMGKRLSFELDIPDALRDARIPPLMLLTLVENAIKHGLNPLSEGGSVRVSAQAQDGTLRLQVPDPRPAGAAASGPGLLRRPGGDRLDQLIDRAVQDVQQRHQHLQAQPLRALDHQPVDLAG